MNNLNDAMEAGPEMDRAVLVACGIGYASHGPSPDKHGFPLLIKERGEGARECKPSSDWNDAMFAAERFGLLHSYKHGCSLSFLDDPYGEPEGWCIWKDETDDPAISFESTGPLAICRAILKLECSR